ncbi:MAG TPA: hypothetical protein VGN23_16315 [Verrucomicrobiae bacterium]|jgi:hypothetical protein
MSLLIIYPYIYAKGKKGQLFLYAAYDPGLKALEKLQKFWLSSHFHGFAAFPQRSGKIAGFIKTARKPGARPRLHPSAETIAKRFSIPWDRFGLPAVIVVKQTDSITRRSPALRIFCVFINQKQLIQVPAHVRLL